MSELKPRGKRENIIDNITATIGLIAWFLLIPLPFICVIVKIIIETFF